MSQSEYDAVTALNKIIPAAKMQSGFLLMAWAV
jgi:hypothetical protein